MLITKQFYWIALLLFAMSNMTFANQEELTNSLPEESNTFSLEDLSGVYSTSSPYDPPWIFSVHIENEEIVIIEMSDHLEFFAATGYISKEEAEQGTIQLSAADKIFIGKINTNPSQDAFITTGILNPLLPKEQRASTASENYPNSRDFLDIGFGFYEKPDGTVTYEMGLGRSSVLFSINFPLGGYIKIF